MDATRISKKKRLKMKKSTQDTTFPVMRYLPSMKGHTAFLTFATSPNDNFNVEIDKINRKEALKVGRESGDGKRGKILCQGKY